MLCTRKPPRKQYTAAGGEVRARCAARLRASRLPATRLTRRAPRAAATQTLAQAAKRESQMQAMLAALGEVQANARAKFDETVDVAIHLNTDAKRTDLRTRGVVSLPHGLGKVGEALRADSEPRAWRRATARVRRREAARKSSGRWQRPTYLPTRPPHARAHRALCARPCPTRCPAEPQSVKVAVFTQDPVQADAARAAGADLVGAEELIQAVKDGKIEFARALATPDAMPLLAQVARILGPKGLMPNPKRGTVLADIAPAVQEAKAGQFEFKAEKAGVVHGPVGRLSFGTHKLRENLDAFIRAVLAKRPDQFKGKPPKVRARGPAPTGGVKHRRTDGTPSPFAPLRCPCPRRPLALARHTAPHTAGRIDQLDDGQERAH